MDDRLAEGFSEKSYSEPEVNNQSLVAPNPNPNPHPTFQGPTPLSVESLETWSQEQGQTIPYNGDRSFYNVSEGGSADRVLPIMVHRVARNEIQGRTTLNRISEVDANSGVNTVRIRRLEDAHERAVRDDESLLQARVETRLKS